MTIKPIPAIKERYFGLMNLEMTDPKKTVSAAARSKAAAAAIKTITPGFLESAA